LTSQPNLNLSKLNEKISEGRYRDVYRYNELVVKKTKPHIIKKLLFIEPTSLYILVNYAIRDLNKYEYKQYESIISKIPSDLHKCFAKVHKPIINSKTCYSIHQLVIDDGGQISKTLSEYGKVNDEQFWSLIDELENRFLENHIYYFSIGPPNICVNKQADERLIPVLIDYKRCGIRTFWHQLPLFFSLFLKTEDAEKISKITRAFQLLLNICVIVFNGRFREKRTLLCYDVGTAIELTILFISSISISFDSVMLS